MAITTTTLITITQAELDRANLETANLAAERDRSQTDVMRLLSSVASLEAERARLMARVAELQAILDTAPTLPPVVTPVVNPPSTTPPKPSAYPGLYADSATLRTKSGSPVSVRGIELMYGQNAHMLGPAGVCALVKALGGNTLSPLFQPSHSTPAIVASLCTAARSAGLLIGVNADHIDAGRNWLSQREMVSAIDGLGNVFLECEVETPEVSSAAQWANGAIGMVKELRAAGWTCPIKVGAPQGGRRVEFPLAAGAEVRAADPLKNVLFTWQAYWGKTGQWYQGQAGVPNGIDGTKAAIAKVGQSGLCFLVGLDWADDVGETGELELMDECHARGVGYQHWVLTNDHIAQNNLVSGGLSLPNITETGRMIQQKLLSQRVLPQL